jgi:hypothetical protein
MGFSHDGSMVLYIYIIIYIYANMNGVY